MYVKNPNWNIFPYLNIWIFLAQNIFQMKFKQKEFLAIKYLSPIYSAVRNHKCDLPKK